MLLSLFFCASFGLHLSSALRLKKQPVGGVVAPGETVILRCAINSPYAVTVFWKNIDKMLYLSMNTLMEPQDGYNVTSLKERYAIVGDQDRGEYFLRIEQFMIDDVGNYTCEYYQNRSVRSRVADLRIATPPNAMYPACSITPRGPHAIGDVVTLSCESVGGTPPASLALRRGSETLRIYLPFGNLPDSLVTHSFILTERDVNRRYTCVARHPALINPRSCSLMPLRNRVGVYLRPLVAKVMEGESTMFTCVAERLPNLRFNWYVDDVKVDGNNRFRQVDSSGQRLLLIDTSIDLDFSLVTCEVIQIGPGHTGIATSLISVDKRPKPTMATTTSVPLSTMRERPLSLSDDGESGDYIGSGGLDSYDMSISSENDENGLIEGSKTISPMTTETSSANDGTTSEAASTAKSATVHISSTGSEVVKDTSHDATFNSPSSSNNESREEVVTSNSTTFPDKTNTRDDITDNRTDSLISNDELADHESTTFPVTSETNKVTVTTNVNNQRTSPTSDSISTEKPLYATKDCIVESTVASTEEQTTTDEAVTKTTPPIKEVEPSSSKNVVHESTSTTSSPDSRRPTRQMNIVFNVSITKPVPSTHKTSMKPKEKLRSTITSTLRREPSSTTQSSSPTTIKADALPQSSTTSSTPMKTTFRVKETSTITTTTKSTTTSPTTPTKLTTLPTTPTPPPTPTTPTPTRKLSEKETSTTSTETTVGVKQPSTTTILIDEIKSSTITSTPFMELDEKHSSTMTPTMELGVISTTDLPKASDTSTMELEEEITFVSRKSTTVRATSKTFTKDVKSSTVERLSHGVTTSERLTTEVSEGVQYKDDKITSVAPTPRGVKTVTLSTDSSGTDQEIVTHATAVTTQASHNGTLTNSQRTTSFVDSSSSMTKNDENIENETNKDVSTFMTPSSPKETIFTTGRKDTTAVGGTISDMETTQRKIDLNETLEVAHGNDSDSEIPNDTDGIGQNDILINLSESHSGQYVDNRVWHYAIIGTGVVVLGIVIVTVVSAIVVSKRKDET